MSSPFGHGDLSQSNSGPSVEVSGGTSRTCPSDGKVCSYTCLLLSNNRKVMSLHQCLSGRELVFIHDIFVSSRMDAFSVQVVTKSPVHDIGHEEPLPVSDVLVPVALPSPPSSGHVETVPVIL